jgi:hypothetical protein
MEGLKDHAVAARDFPKETFVGLTLPRLYKAALNSSWELAVDSSSKGKATGAVARVSPPAIRFLYLADAGEGTYVVVEFRKVSGDGLPPPGSAFTLRNAG